MQILGPLRVWRGEVELDPGPRQQRCLLALLLAHEGRPISMADLVDLIWRADPPHSATNVVHKYVGALRRLLEPDLPTRTAGSYLTRRDAGYRFTAGPQTLDLVAFRRLVAQAKERVRQERPLDALDHYVKALRLCHGPAGDTLADSAAATAAFAGIDGEFFDAAVAAATVAVRAGCPARVLPPLRLAARMGRLHEPVHASLVTTLAAAGRQAEALEAYRGIRDHLAEELGIDPGQELRQAQRQVLTQAVAVPAKEHRPRPAQLPPDQPRFVGRTRELAALHELAAELRDTGRTSPLVVAVYGIAGVGKSTLVTHFAHQVADVFADGQLHLDLRGREGDDGGLPGPDALLSMVYALGLPKVPDAYEALVGTYRSLTARKRILVILDDARDAEQVRPLLPSAADSLVLVTSRRPLIGLAAADGARLLQIQVPELAEARDILTARLAVLPGWPAGFADLDTVDEIVQHCGRLPLTLALVAAGLSVRPTLSLASVAAELRDQ
ncbi:DNA-binding transcriptional activator of the SARP family [Asanoa hainanensis]|uniref:DNA-binding transcriptional activator of the SARP family n=1 Tax=Asanoa hainanensis TaxID=560556 RepID=A0A239M3V7_9ACTN|nr:AfsR/SARP family transcriptional regulator [Asanoa hainanensis]SNT37346.1 DNA-binding transcriptional activator of the SARP family [Asanoa hainanensis]